MSIIIKSEREIAAMREAGRVVAIVLGVLAGEVKPGVRTKDLDVIAARELARLGARSSFKGYHGFPAHLCVSVNDEVVHGIPGDRVLAAGDIVSLDFGAIVKGFQGDAAITVGVDRVSSEAERLMETARGALEAGIAAARAGGRLSDISAAIQSHVELRGFSVVREYTGHGIGRSMHEEPLVPNYGPAGEGPELRQGMTLALEPMVAVGDWRTRLNGNQWTVHTADGSLAAHFEHTIAIKDGDAEILTVV